MYQSRLYWKFIGIGQLLAGGLLMTQRYSKLGALVNLPIIANIFVITLSYEFANTPFITGLMLLANILLILWEWGELKVLVNLPANRNTMYRMENNVLWQIIGLVLFLFTCIYKIAINKYDLIFWFTACLLIGVGGLIFGIITQRLIHLCKGLNGEFSKKQSP